VSTGAILLCAGRGERMGAGVPKAFVPLAGRPLFTWSLAALQRCAEIEAIVVVGPVRTARELLAASGSSFARVVEFVEGGAERQVSVARGLAALPAVHDLVAVHDAARALVSSEVVSRTVAAARAHGAAIAAVPLADTLKAVADGVIAATPPRAGLWRAQTPQVFRRDWLEAGHAAATDTATDDAALVEALGHEVRVVEGDPLNFKITTPADLALAEAWLGRAASRPTGGTP
jgi:2-C-methyl-D-erythritol 4-phosphate cytidylyltransferase